jgi:hypothetical protein
MEQQSEEMVHGKRNEKCHQKGKKKPNAPHAPKLTS